MVPSRPWTSTFAALWSLLVTMPVLAAPVVLPQLIFPGFGSTRWVVANDAGTSSGTPFAGTCDVSPTLGILEGTSANGAQDAYDIAWSIYVAGAPFVAPGNPDLTGTTLTSGTGAMSGLNVTAQYYFSPSSSLARIMVFMENTSAAPIATTVQVPVNFGSDALTRVETTSSGDAMVTTADRWIVTSDTFESDPVNTTVLYGPGSPAVTPIAYTQTVFDCSSVEGLGATFNVVVPAGATRSLMFFAGLAGVTVVNNTVVAATAAASQFNSNATLLPDWLVGLTAEQQAQILNWQLPLAADVAARPIPTLSEWATIALAVLLAGFGVHRLLLATPTVRGASGRARARWWW